METAKTLKISENDIVRYSRGTGYYMVEKQDKCKQDVRGILTTETRASTGLGASLEEAIGQDVNDPLSTFFNSPQGFEFQNRVSISLKRLMQAQKRYLMGFRPSSEVISSFSSVKFWKDNIDPRVSYWSVNIVTVDGKSSFTIRGTTPG